MGKIELTSKQKQFISMAISEGYVTIYRRGQKFSLYGKKHMDFELNKDSPIFLEIEENKKIDIKELVNCNKDVKQ